MKVISVSGTTVTVEDGGRQVQKSVKADATVMIDGNSAKLSDLKKGDDATFIGGDPATTVTVTR